MASNTQRSAGKSLLIVVLLVIIGLLIWLWLEDEDHRTPDLKRAMVAELTAYEKGDATRPYKVFVYVNPDRRGVIVKRPGDREYAQGFVYGVANTASAQVSLKFYVVMLGSDQQFIGEDYFLTLNPGGTALLDWHQRRATGEWVFRDR